MPPLAYCTILARNYLPSALTLAESLQRFGSGGPLFIFLTDLTPDTALPDVPGVRWMGPSSLDLNERSVLELAMGYDLVEFATAVKPLVLQTILREYEQVAYLDPDTYLVSEMVELEAVLNGGSQIVLTPHYLEATPPGSQFSEGHLLHVGVYNLGFCAVRRDARAFLDWWWGHLKDECLHEPLAGLFVDQKWVDVGSVLFGATALRHYGYNVSVANLHERPITRDADGYAVGPRGDRLRLFHFHAYDPHRPDELATRQGTSSGRAVSDALIGLSKEYAAAVLRHREQTGPAPDYRYATDTSGRRISRRLRQAYRIAALTDAGKLPSPFVADEAAEWERWRHDARRLVAQLAVSDIAKGMRVALPEEYERLKDRVPGLASRFRRRYVKDTGMWG